MMCKHELSVPLEVSAAPPRNLWRCTCKLTSMRNLQTPHNWLMTQRHFVTWWRSCALLLRWEHRSPRQGFRNLGTHCGPGQICSCLYIRLGYHKIVKTSVLRRKFLFFKKRPRIFPPNLKLQEDGDRDRIFKNEMVYWDKQPFANLKGRNACWIWSMHCVTFALYHFCSQFRIVAAPASASEKNDGIPGSCRPPGRVKIPPPGANVSTTLKNTT